MRADNPEVIIIGQGITGLGIAFWLKKRGINFILLANDNTAGGTMKSIREDGFLYETGANSATETTLLFKELLNDLHLENEIIYLRPENKRGFILRNNILHSAPDNVSGFLATRLLQFKSKSRILKEPFIHPSGQEESVAEFCKRRFGQEFLDYIIDPLVTGKYAGATERLSMMSAFQNLYHLEEVYGSVLKGIVSSKNKYTLFKRSRKFSFINGMQTLPAAIASSLGDSIKYNAKVTGISDQSLSRNEPEDNPDARRFLLEYLQNGMTKKLESNLVVFAIPAYEAAAILKNISPQIAGVLSTIYYAPVTSVFIGAHQEDIAIRMNGAGFIVPSTEKRGILGCIWNSSLFTNRAPSDLACFNTYLGGTRNPDIAMLDDTGTIDLTLRELKSIMQFTGKPVYLRIIRWKYAIPQYEIGHRQKLDELERFEQTSGIVLRGNYRGGVSVDECIKSAFQTAEMIAKKIEET